MSVFAILSSSAVRPNPRLAVGAAPWTWSQPSSVPPVGADGDHEADHRRNDRGQHHPLGPVVDLLDGDRRADETEHDRDHLVDLHPDLARPAAEELLARLVLRD